MDDYNDLDELIYQNDQLMPNQQQQFGSLASYAHNDEDILMNDGDNANPPVHSMMTLPASTNCEQKKLSNDTIRRIQSEQVITDISSCVKELLENALDARANRIEVILEKGGLDLIKVKDNGIGIPPEDHNTVCCPHYTSKIEDFSDLERLSTYGFRGEALSSLANLSGELQIITKTNEDSHAWILSFEKDGTLKKKEKCPTDEPIGTQVMARKLMDSFAVRREVLQKNVKNQVKKIGDILVTYSLIRPEVQIMCKDDGKPLVVGRRVNSIADSVKLNLGPMMFENLMPIQLSKDSLPFKVSGFLPAPDAETKEILRSNSDRQYVYVNKRPVAQPVITKMLNQHIRRHFNDNKRKYPVFLIHIECDPSEYDVNYVPNKDKLQLHSESSLKSLIEEFLVSTYPAVHNPPPPVQQSTILDTPPSDIGTPSNPTTDMPSSPNLLGDFDDEQPLQRKQDQNNSSTGNSFFTRSSSTTLNNTKFTSPSTNSISSSNVNRNTKSSQFTMDDFATTKQSQKSQSGNSNKRKRDSDFADGVDDFKDAGEDMYAGYGSNTRNMENQEFEGEFTVDVNLQTIQSDFLNLVSSNPAQAVQVVDNPSQVPIKFSKEDLKSISVIGKVDDFNESTQGVTFICKFKDQLLLFDPVRAEEALIFNETKTNMKFPIEKLEAPIRLTEMSIGGYKRITYCYTNRKQNWDLASRSVVDEALLYNGFQLLRISENGRLQLLISGITKEIPGYGIHDLAHLLNILVQTGDVTVSPNEYIPRAPEALKYLAEAASKNSQKLGMNVSRSDVENIIKRLQQTPGPLIDVCPHKQPLWNPLRQWKIPN